MGLGHNRTVTQRDWDTIGLSHDGTGTQEADTLLNEKTVISACSLHFYGISKLFLYAMVDVLANYVFICDSCYFKTFD